MIRIVMLPGLDGTGKRLAEFTRRIRPTADVHVITYPCDEASGYAELEPLVRAALRRSGC